MACQRRMRRELRCIRFGPMIILGMMVFVFGPQAKPVRAQAVADERGETSKSELRQRFGEQAFLPDGGFVLRQGNRLPELVWEHPDSVARVIDDLRIPTRWFNDRFEEVTIAENVGRYFAYGEAPVPAGPVMRRAMTCCCLSAEQDLTGLAQKWLRDRPPKAEVMPAGDDVEARVHRWKSTEEGAVELAAWLETGQSIHSVRTGQWQMENATRHVRLKRMLMGLENPPVQVKARVVTGQPVAVLRPALREDELQESSNTRLPVKELLSKLDQWYADSGEPMAVVVAHKGVIVASKAYGEVDGKQVTINTPMRLDSAMKPLIGLQLATYVDRGLVALDEPVGNYLPEFNTAENRNLTFRAGQAHVTGIHFPWDLAFSRLFYFHTWHESLIAHCRREWPPGDRYRYGVVGVILSVRAIELLRGRNYWDAMERDLFEPLEIDDMLPGGTGFSAEDMARIGVLLANRGKYGKRELFSNETYQAIIPTSLEPYFPRLKTKYGIGLQDKSSMLGPGSFGHGGGCGTQLAVNPDQHLVFAMVRNHPGKEYRQHLSDVARILKNWVKRETSP